MFIDFANFYQCFIQGFSRIATPLTSMLKIIRLSKQLGLKTFRTDDDEIVDDSGSRVNEMVRNLSKNLTLITNIGAIEEPNFLILDAKKAFNYLRLAFIKALILQHFNLKSHIKIEIDVSGYAIDGLLS